MYLSSLTIKNFRCFDNNEHVITFNSGLTILVGENDSGKSAILDAIKIVLGTTDMNWYRIESDDFYNEDTSREIEIICKFDDLSDNEKGAFLECLTYEDNERKEPCLYLYWNCKYLKTFKPPRTVSNLSTGRNGNGNSPSTEAREILRATYLRALRDAYSDMQSGKRSRLSQIIQNVSMIDSGDNKYVKGMDVDNLSIVGIAELSNYLLGNHHVLEKISNDMTTILSEQMLLKGDKIKTKLQVSESDSNDFHKAVALLEKLDLCVDRDECFMQGKVGLGTSNIISMACEFLLHKQVEEHSKSCFLLIEEPESHVHAQRQLKLIKSLENEAEKGKKQIIITTHSPLLASVVKLNNVVIVRKGKVFPLQEKYTMLEASDYLFLEKYLDATKANLFFARSVVIVEGPAEALLLPTLAKLLGYNFTDYGTSLIDVRSKGLRRYARIFQRKDTKTELDINVSCITDRDIMPNCAPHICFDEKYNENVNTWPEKTKRSWRAEADYTEKEVDNYIKAIKEKTDGQRVKTFISDHWTFEYDLIYDGLKHNDMKEVLINALLTLCYKQDNLDKNKEKFTNEMDHYVTIEEKSSYFYSYFILNRVSKADFAQQLAVALENIYLDKGHELETKIPTYLVKAIKYATKGEISE